MILTSLRRCLAVAIFFASAWCLYVYGFGHVVSERVIESKVVSAEMAAMPYLSADALGIVAEQGSSLVDSEALSMRALSQDPSNGRAAAYLMTLLVSESRQDEAADLADLAGRLWPAHTYTHSRLADYWIAQNRTDKLIQELGLLMVREPSLRKDFFPLVEELAVSSGDLDLLGPFIQSPPNWWGSFFHKLSSTQSIERLIEIYERREKSSTAIDAYERRSLVNRLIREKQWSEAYTYWQVGLDSSEKALLVNGLYDGGFESGEFNLGFGWIVGRNSSFDIKPRVTYGSVDRKALQILFKQGSKRVHFRHLSQRILLDVGRYKLNYRVRLDTLKNLKGLVWRVRCIADGNRVLAESAPMKGRQPWKSFTLEFAVPSSCTVQSIGLEAASRFAHDHVFSGQLWLDDISLTSEVEGKL